MTDPRTSQVATVTASDIVGWLLIIIVAVIIYLLFQRKQVRIARHAIVRQLEEEIAMIFRSKSAQVEVPSPSGVQLEPREFRAVLDNEPLWSFEQDNSAQPVTGWTPPISTFIDGQRYWLIRTTKTHKGQDARQFLASHAFQETLLWFRRVNRARRDKVVTADDLLDLWRFILPLGFAGRISYFAQYFQGAEDVQAMVEVINETLRIGVKRDRRRPLCYFRSYVSEQDLDILRANRKSRRLYKDVSTIEKYQVR